MTILLSSGCTHSVLHNTSPKAFFLTQCLCVLVPVHFVVTGESGYRVWVWSLWAKIASHFFPLLAMDITRKTNGSLFALQTTVPLYSKTPQKRRSTPVSRQLLKGMTQTKFQKKKKSPSEYFAPQQQFLDQLLKFNVISVEHFYETFLDTETLDLVKSGCWLRVRNDDQETQFAWSLKTVLSDSAPKGNFYRRKKRRRDYLHLAKKMDSILACRSQIYSFARIFRFLDHWHLMELQESVLLDDTENGLYLDSIRLTDEDYYLVGTYEDERIWI